MDNKVFTDFETSLAAGDQNQAVVTHEFEYRGVPVFPTEGKHDFDFYLPDGRSVEVKLDLRSQATGCGAVEWPTLMRGADLYIYTLTYARVFTKAQLQALYNRGKIPNGGFGPQGYDGRYIRNMGREGMPLWQFIESLKVSERMAA